MDKQDAIQRLKKLGKDTESIRDYVKNCGDSTISYDLDIEALLKAIEALTDHKPTNRLEKMRQMGLFDFAKEIVGMCENYTMMYHRDFEECIEITVQYLLQEVEDEK